MKTIPILPGIALHELRTADAADIFAAIDGERAYLGHWLPFVQFTRSEEDSLRFVRSVLEAPYREAVFRSATGSVSSDSSVSSRPIRLPAPPKSVTGSARRGRGAASSRRPSGRFAAWRARS